MPPTQPGGGGAGGESSSSSSEAQSAFNDLKRLIPSLAAELELLRTSLREHSLWLLRYGHGHSDGPPPGVSSSSEAGAGAASETAGQQQQPPPSSKGPSHALGPASQPRSSQPPGPSSSSSSSALPAPGPPTEPPPAFTEAEPPAYTASDVPPYTGGFSTVSASTREEVAARRDQLLEWLREGEDVLREYSARHAQLAAALGLPDDEDLLGTWHEAHPDNALPGYRQIEPDEGLMVGGVGEVPPPYLRGRPSQGVGVVQPPPPPQLPAASRGPEGAEGDAGEGSSSKEVEGGR